MSKNTTPEGAAAQPKTLIYVHCRGFKPAAPDLGSLCRDAIGFGLRRDRPKVAAKFEAAGQEMVYYGDLNQQVLCAEGQSYDAALDLRDRQHALNQLKALDKAKKFTLSRYDRLPGKTSRKEFLADLVGPLLDGVGLSQMVIGKLIPELRHYWQPGYDYRRSLLNRVLARLGSALRRGDDIMVLSHGLGSVAVYDALWQLSHDSQAGSEPTAGKVESWVTLGSPLGNTTVRARLCGAGEKSNRRYPANIVNWHNVAAEDDYLCHDKTILDDFSAMLKYQLVSQIRDYKIYNLAVRYGKSNPHSSIGYLSHPRVIALIADWLSETRPG